MHILDKLMNMSIAFLKLYGSQLYYALNNEKTKVWYYSAEKLFQLFEEEMAVGKLELPEY